MSLLEWIVGQTRHLYLWRLRTIAACLLAIVPYMSCFAGQLLTDLELEMVVSPDDAVYPVGSIVEITFTVTNHGPDESPRSTVQMSEFTFGGPNLAVQVSIFPHIGTAPCQYEFLHLSPPEGMVGYETPQLRLQPLASGETRVCSVLLLVEPTASGTYPLSARLFNSSPLAVDPILSNNSVSRPLQVGNQSARPIPASSPGQLILISLLIGISVLMGRKRI